ncbi:MAG: UDP-glucose 4-epimerase GalE [Candidatus Omnitrophica bacterium]|nr:UDP-glucose 4-epimerase GalE [Candidatus Omnitrophota bacterium]
MKTKTILVTGGAGYIGSHMVRVLREAGFKPVIFDNLSTGHREFIPRGVPFVCGDLRDPKDIRKAFIKHKIDAVIHFAALIVVPESVIEPFKYYENNVLGSLNLFSEMERAGIRNVVFSSSACVYGQPLRNPIMENEPLKVANPYGATKVMVEQILGDLAFAGKMKYVALRYFNVAGAHPSGEIGIKMDRPTHLIPNVMQAASGKVKEMKVFGHNYPTPDGTGVRDYIHVLDLCEAHLLALKLLFKRRECAEMINLGNGKGFSVLQVIRAAQKVTGRKIPFKLCPKRPGDCPSVVASFQKAKKVLGWAPKRGLDEILSSAWGWEQKISSRT